MLITLTVLSLLCCYREAEGGANGSIHRTNDLIAPSASTSYNRLTFAVRSTTTESTPTMASTSSNRLATNSAVRPTTTESSPAMASTSSNRLATNSVVRPTNTPNKLKISVNISLHEHDVPFFSTDFKTRLAIWKKLLQNTSRHCIEPNYINEKSIEIDFPVFGVKEDVEDSFLPLETILPVLVRRKKKHDLVQIACMAILELWPLLVLCFSCAALSGMVVWILVSCFCTRSFF